MDSEDEYSSTSRMKWHKLRKVGFHKLKLIKVADDFQSEDSDGGKKSQKRRIQME